METCYQLRHNISDIGNLGSKTSGYAHLSWRGGGRIILEPAVESNVVVPDKEKKRTAWWGLCTHAEWCRQHSHMMRNLKTSWNFFDYHGGPWLPSTNPGWLFGRWTLNWYICNPCILLFFRNQEKLLLSQSSWYFSQATLYVLLHNFQDPWKLSKLCTLCLC